jgi:hypothetical protein
MQKTIAYCGCGEQLQKEYSGPDTIYVCCPKSHYEEGHVCYVDGDHL